MFSQQACLSEILWSRIHGMGDDRHAVSEYDAQFHPRHSMRFGAEKYVDGIFSAVVNRERSDRHAPCVDDLCSGQIVFVGRAEDPRRDVLLSDSQVYLPRKLAVKPYEVVVHLDAPFRGPVAPGECRDRLAVLTVGVVVRRYGCTGKECNRCGGMWSNVGLSTLACAATWFCCAMPWCAASVAVNLESNMSNVHFEEVY